MWPLDHAPSKHTSFSKHTQTVPGVFRSNFFQLIEYLVLTYWSKLFPFITEIPSRLIRIYAHHVVDPKLANISTHVYAFILCTFRIIPFCLIQYSFILGGGGSRCKCIIYSHPNTIQWQCITAQFVNVMANKVTRVAHIALWFLLVRRLSMVIERHFVHRPVTECDSKTDTMSD